MNHPNSGQKLVERNGDSHGTHNTNSQIKFETPILNSILCDLSHTYLLVKETITVAKMAATGAAAYNSIEEVTFKSCSPFTDCISEINNTQIDKAECSDVLILMYNLIDYKNSYSKSSGSLWQCYRDKSALNDAGAIGNFPGSIVLLRFKQ